MTDLALLISAAREAGALALDYQARGLTVTAKDDRSPVTDGDFAVNALLKERLLRARPDYGWLSEETVDNPARLGRRRLFVVDPIDGTTAYLNKQPWYSISLAVVEDGRPIVGVVYAPSLDHLYSGEIGGAPQLNGSAIGVGGRRDLEGCAMLADPRALAAAAWPPMEVTRRNSIALRLCLVAGDSFDAAASVSTLHEWDLAAGDLIAGLSGAVVTDSLGVPLAYNRADPTSSGLICANGALHSLILETLDDSSAS
jgi:myo-inositol-1(or 4)-monophosphatase